jgi:hypothetical protein
MFTAIRFVIALLVTQGTMFALVRLAGGRGEFDTPAYLGSLFNVPLSSVSTLLSGLK